MGCRATSQMPYLVLHTPIISKGWSGMPSSSLSDVWRSGKGSMERCTVLWRHVWTVWGSRTETSVWGRRRKSATRGPREFVKRYLARTVKRRRFWEAICCVCNRISFWSITILVYLLWAQHLYFSWIICLIFRIQERRFNHLEKPGSATVKTPIFWSILWIYIWRKLI